MKFGGYVGEGTGFSNEQMIPTLFTHPTPGVQDRWEEGEGPVSPISESLDSAFHPHCLCLVSYVQHGGCLPPPPLCSFLRIPGDLSIMFAQSFPSSVRYAVASANFHNFLYLISPLLEAKWMEGCTPDQYWLSLWEGAGAAGADKVHLTLYVSAFPEFVDHVVLVVFCWVSVIPKQSGFKQ